jgi:tRNA 2-selenouridine synthase
MHYLQTDEFLKLCRTVPLVDVRAPKEFLDGHLSKASNIPIFDDWERAEVGTVYKQKGRQQAIEKGLELVGPKMSELAKSAKTLSANNDIAIYCWRGGMRSEKMAWLFELVGLKTYVLKGGYKAFRSFLAEEFRNASKLIVLQGPTGSGKTDILKQLKESGEQVLDLEKLANHKGSAFGGLGLGPQPTTQQFQNELYWEYFNLDHSKRIWIESESLTIGRVYLPEDLWESMNNSTVLEIQMDRALRAQRLVREYGQFQKEELERSIIKISSRFGGNRVKEALNHLENGALYDVALLLLEYYDKCYDFSREKYKKPSIGIINTNSSEALLNSRLLIEKANDLNL